MKIITNILMALYLISALSSLIILYMSIFVRQAPKSLHFSYLALSIFLFALGYFFEINAGSHDAAVMAAKMEYLGVPFIAPHLFLFVCEYCAKIKLTAKHVISVMAIPVIAAILVITWPFTHIFYKELIFEEGPFISRLKVNGGIFYAVFFSYTYILMLASIVIVIYCRRKGDARFKKQTSTLFFGTVLPGIGNIVNVLKLGGPGYDITPILLSVTCILLGYSVFRHGLYMLEPIAQEQIIENMSDGFILVDMQGRFIDANISAKTLFPQLSSVTMGARISDLKGMSWIDADNSLEKEFSLTDESGSKKHYRTSRSFIKNSGKAIGKCIMMYDITEAKEHLDEVSQLAEHDALTGIINRGALYRKGKELFSQFGEKSEAAILMMDIDFFKNINDTYGHLNGDEVLKSVADALSSSLRSTDLIGRYGGEEFCAFLVRIGREDVVSLAEKLRDAIEKLDLILDCEKVSVTISIGVSAYDFNRHTSFEAFLSDADAALYKAKKSGRNCVKMFASE